VSETTRSEKIEAAARALDDMTIRTGGSEWLVTPRVLVENLRAALSEEPRREQAVTATHRCNVCDARWRDNNDGTWTLVSTKAGACCDNQPMRDQIEPLTPPQPAPQEERCPEPSPTGPGRCGFKLPCVLHPAPPQPAPCEECGGSGDAHCLSCNNGGVNGAGGTCMDCVPPKPCPACKGTGDASRPTEETHPVDCSHHGPGCPDPQPYPSGSGGSVPRCACGHPHYIEERDGKRWWGRCRRLASCDCKVFVTPPSEGPVCSPCGGTGWRGHDCGDSTCGIDTEKCWRCNGTGRQP
jgi:hypothetical protein